jgi:uncharacterized protein YbjT (DUF2867 family)
VKLLVIGGTRFVGRAFVELAVRHGHDVAVFHRSVSEPEDFPSVEHLHGDQAQEWFPMWEPQFPGAHTYDAAKAVAAGLRCRPFAQTVADTLAWDQQRGRPDLCTGLSAEMETELLATWHSRR